MKKHFFKYKRNKTLLELTLLLIFCIGIIIRDNEFPLTKLNNFMDKYIELLFLSSSPDRTFYNSSISYLDDNLSELICMLPTKELFDIADNIYEQIQRSTNAEILCHEVLDEIEQTISELQIRYGLLFESFYITNDLTLRSQYIKYLPSLVLYTNNELEIKVRLKDVII